MAPNLARSQHDLIRDMILDGSLTQVGMANVAGCSDRTIRNIGSNMRLFGKTKAPTNGAGRQRLITPPMLAALCDRLLEKPGLFRDEMAVFLYDEFDVLVSVASIGRALASINWTKKATRRIANERNADLRDFYLHKLSSFRSYQLVYVDESGCDKRIGFRRTGWSPLGVAPVEIAQFHRDRRHQILPAYSRILWSSCFTIVSHSQRRTLSSSWTMHPSITVSELSRCAVKLVSNCYICLLILPTSTRLKSSLQN
jgi:hypothetical protein